MSFNGLARTRGSRIKRFAVIAAALLLTVLATAYFMLSRTASDLWPWHHVILEGEFTAEMASELRETREGGAGDSTGTPFDAYRALEERLFAELDETLCPQSQNFRYISRYDPDSPTNPGFLRPCRRSQRADSEASGFSYNWNRTYDGETLATRFPDLARDRPDPEQGEVRGAALLLHGLSDSPYSLLSLAKPLYASGFDVIALRLPGHGTLPTGIEVATVEDWTAGVRIAAQEVARRAGPSGSMIVVGYSVGAALALDYTIEALDDVELRVPDRLVMLSPALAADAATRIAIWLARIGRLPGLHHHAWFSTLPEYDPFKYNSFPFSAVDQYSRLTERVEERLSLLEQERLDELPPVLVIQSVVDATVKPQPSLSRLFGRLQSNGISNGSELVLFDANRMALIDDLLKPEVENVRWWLQDLERKGRLGFSVTTVTNLGTNEANVRAQTLREAASTADAAVEADVASHSLGLEWPLGSYSLSHVAIPFPPEDPVYGVNTMLSSPFPLGLLELRGEYKLLKIPQDLLSRMRYNPFYPYLETRVLTFVSGVAWQDHLDETGIPATPRAGTWWSSESDRTRSRPE